MRFDLEIGAIVKCHIDRSQLPKGNYVIIDLSFDKHVFVVQSNVGVKSSWFSNDPHFSLYQKAITPVNISPIPLSISNIPLPIIQIGDWIEDLNGLLGSYVNNTKNKAFKVSKINQTNSSYINFDVEGTPSRYLLHDWNYISSDFRKIDPSEYARFGIGAGLAATMLEDERYNPSGSISALANKCTCDFIKQVLPYGCNCGGL